MLTAASIPDNRCGIERTARLSAQERALYRWVIDRFARATPPTVRQLVEQAHALALDAEVALAALAREDLVHTDEDGAPTVAYPFSAQARGHEVALDARVVQAMCAIDALGIAAMLQRPIEVRSHDPISDTKICVHANPDGVTDWQPETAVVLAGSSSCEGPSYCGCCDVLNFFESTETAQRYLREHPGVKGMQISIQDAAAAGRAIFGAILGEMSSCRRRSTAASWHGCCTTSKHSSSRYCRRTSTRTSTFPARSTSRSRRSTPRTQRSSIQRGR